MNRAFLIILVPAVLVAAGYFFASASFGVRLNYLRLFGAIVAFLVAVVVVRAYRKRHAPPRGR